MNDKLEMTDAQMLSRLRSMAYWVSKEPWGPIADRFEEMSLKQLMDLEVKVMSTRANSLSKG